MGAPSRGVLAAIVVIAIALLGAAIAAGGAGHPRTPFISSANRDPAEVWAVGDGADGSPESYAVARMIAGSKPDRFLYLGDVYENGTAADCRDHYDALFGPRSPSARRRRRATTSGPSAPTAMSPTGRRCTDGRLRRYYAVSRAGGWQILSLNSEAAQ